MEGVAYRSFERRAKGNQVVTAEDMGIDPEKVNPVGSAIALGHPLGATGAILTLTCAYGLRRAKKKYGVVTMCIGGGQGISLVLESVH